jgi:hypothetical protein
MSGMKNNNAALQRISHEQEKGQGQIKIKITQKNLHTLKSRKCEIQKRYVNRKEKKWKKGLKKKGKQNELNKRPEKDLKKN